MAMADIVRADAAAGSCGGDVDAAKPVPNGAKAQSALMLWLVRRDPRAYRHDDAQPWTNCAGAAATQGAIANGPPLGARHPSRGHPKPQEQRAGESQRQ